jgi:uncharacterized protein YlbG (UPF0298 family)
MNGIRTTLGTDIAAPRHNLCVATFGRVVYVKKKLIFHVIFINPCSSQALTVPVT